jgi:hypothetical protein
MSIVLNERFEGPGFENTWVEVVGGGNSLDEDASTVLAGSPSGWLNDCLEVTVLDAAFNGYISKDLSSPLSKSFVRFDMVVTNETLADGDILVLATGKDITSVAWFVGILQTAGIVNLVIDVRYDGTTHVVISEPLALNSRYRFEFKWDADNDLWEWWLNGVSKGSGALTSTHVLTINTVFFGNIAVAHNKTATIYYDNIAIDNNEYLGSRGLPEKLSVRQLIVNAIITQLKTISMLNGYNTNLANNATEQQTENAAIDTLPDVQVLDVSEEAEVRGQLSYNTLTVDLTGRVASDSISDARNLLTDIVEVMKAGPSYPSNVYMSTLINMPDLTPELKENKVMKFTVTYTIKYRV